MDGDVRAAALRGSWPEGGLIELSDGGRVYARSIREPTADGLPILLLDGLGCEGYVWKRLVPWLSHRHPVVHWNYRGHGQSPTPTDLDEITLERVLADLFEVMDLAALDHAVLLGHSMGVQVALEACARRPDRVSGLGLLFGSYEHPIESWHGPAARSGRPTLSNVVMRRVFDPLTLATSRYGHLVSPVWRLILGSPLAYEFATRLEVDGRRLSWVDFGPYLKELARIDPRVFTKMARDLADHSAAEALRHIRVPTLVVGGTHDTFTPLWRSVEMARQIPGAELLVVEGGTHTGPLEFPTLVGDSVDRFLARRLGQPLSDALPARTGAG